MDPQLVKEFHRRGWWGDRTLAGRVGELAVADPDGDAYVTAATRLSWREYDETSTAWARAVAARFSPGDRVAVQLADGPDVHVAFLALQKAGLVTVGIGQRAGPREVEHLVSVTGARALLTPATIGDALGGPPAEDPLPDIHPDELWLLNSTSGTTGLPKCVMHNQNRWCYFHQLAVRAGGLGRHDVFLSALPAPFGFGIWTAHVTPTLLGVPTVVLDRFDAGAVLDLVERERVTVLCCVSTQFIMLLDELGARSRDLSSLRVMFTGGEAVPYQRAAEFEERTGAAVLQFYGSNETGALSNTSRHDSPDRRLRSAGLVIPEMHVRLLDPGTGADVDGRGRPACRGPAMSLGYWGDDAANAELFTPDGWMLMGDIVEIDGEGELRVVGRTSDFVIRGGKNISAPAVEAEVGTHPAVTLAAVVAAPDPVFGERVAVYVELRPGATLTLEELVAHLAARRVSKEWFPERFAVLDALPRSSGGKVAKGELRRDARTRFAGPTAAPRPG